MIGKSAGCFNWRLTGTRPDAYMPTAVIEETKLQKIALPAIVKLTVI